jgi:hypothetical protein
MNTRTVETLETRENVNALVQCGKLLHHLQGENAALKTQLAEVIRVCADSEQLETLESFQARFIAKDTVIAIVRRDLAKLVATSRSEAFPTPEQGTASVKFGRDMLCMKEQFLNLRNEFEEYLTNIPEFSALRT